MQKQNTPKQLPASTTLRAIIEIVGGELKIVPIAQSAAEEKLILDALRFVIEDHAQR